MALVSRPYGVTAALVASRIQSFELSVTSRPSTADVTAIVDEEAAWVAARLRRIGVGPELDDQSETYLIARRVIFMLAESRILDLRGRANTDLGAATQRRAGEILDAIQVGPQGLGDGAEGSESHRVQTIEQHQRAVDRWADRHGGLGRRLARRNRL